MKSASAGTEGLPVGSKASFRKTITEYDVCAFAGISGDLNPVHISITDANESVFGKRVAHGMLTASLISAVLGNRLPGPGTIYLGQELRFHKPVYIGDTITAEVEVVDVNIEARRVKLATVCTNQDGVVVVSGSALVVPPH
jgi:3-hydroxybutyryl-CoA dehydratase